MNRIFIFLLISFSILLFPSLSHAQVSKLWTNQIKNSLNSVNKAVCMDIDQFGNCYIAGVTWVADSTKDILLMKFTPDGEEIWRRFYDGPSHHDDVPVAMCLDHYGDVIIAGTSNNAKGDMDICLVKFSNEGVPVFSKNIDGGFNLFDAPTSVTCDAAGNIYTGGYVTTPDSGLNLAIYRFYIDGSPSWEKRSGTMNMDVANVLVSDDSCNVYVGGNYNAGIRTSDMIVQKFDSVGTKKWEYIYDGTLSMSDALFQMAADDSVNLYLSGFMNHGSDRSDIPVFKLNRNGEMLQENVFFGGMTDCITRRMHVDKTGAYLTILQTDYMRGTTASIAVHYDKAGEQKMMVRNESGVRFSKLLNYRGTYLILGNSLVKPDNTLIPYIAEADTNGEFKWEFADSTVAGLAHLLDYRVRGDHLYFLGDDTGEATGTISLFCYQLKKESANKPKGTQIKSSKGAIRKN